MKNILYFCCFVCCSLLLSSCSKQQENNQQQALSQQNGADSSATLKPDTTSSFFPLNKGTMWIFSVEYQDLNTGQIIPPTQDFPYARFDTLYVHGTTLLGDRMCALLRTPSALAGGMWYTHRAKGIYSWIQDPADTTQQPVFYLTYKYPAAKGEIYESNHIKVDVKDTAEYIKVQAGNYNCYVYHSIAPATGGGTYENTVWIAPGTGMIQNDGILRQKGQNSMLRRVKLMSFVKGSGAPLQ